MMRLDARAVAASAVRVVKEHIVQTQPQAAFLPDIPVGVLSYTEIHGAYSVLMETMTPIAALFRVDLTSVNGFQHFEITEFRKQDTVVITRHTLS